MPIPIPGEEEISLTTIPVEQGRNDRQKRKRTQRKKKKKQQTHAKMFKNNFKTMPWLALPYKDISCVRLPRIFRYPFELDEWHPDPLLVIIGPRGEFVVPFGAATVLKNFGVEAYPFAHDRAYQLHAERIKNMKLEMLWDSYSVFVRDCMSEDSISGEVVVPFDDIVGKRIVVFCECVNDEQHMEFRVKLLERYKEAKGGIDEFEVIYFKGGKHAEAVPWLIPRPCRGHATDVLARILYYGYGILVFDADGRVVRATSNPVFEDRAFPFYTGSIEGEARSDLIDSFEWYIGDATFRS